MGYDFDTAPDRHNSDSFKWARYAGRDVLPMWVADMDFQVAPEIATALQQRLNHGVFGYASPRESLREAVCEMLEREHGWTIEPGWLVWLPGVVPGMSACCRIAGELGDEVITSPPIYHHFLRVAQSAGRALVTAPLQREGGRYTFDLDALRESVTPRSRLMMLCNPHNPVGRAFDLDELRAVLSLCAEHELLVCSDEIHCGLVLDRQKRHIPSALVLPEYAEQMITLMSPSKTFNLAGLNCAFAVIQNPSLRRRFIGACHEVLPMVNTIGLAATEAAYRHGGAWQAALLNYLRDNYALIEREVAQMPGLRLEPLEATYLAWLDLRTLQLEHPLAFFEQAGVGLSGGAEFGDANYLRLNFGCPRAQLAEALRRMRAALQRR